MMKSLIERACPILNRLSQDAIPVGWSCRTHVRWPNPKTVVVWRAHNRDQNCRPPTSLVEGFSERNTNLYSRVTLGQRGLPQSELVVMWLVLRHHPHHKISRCRHCGRSSNVASTSSAMKKHVTSEKDMAHDSHRRVDRHRLHLLPTRRTILTDTRAVLRLVWLFDGIVQKHKRYNLSCIAPSRICKLHQPCAYVGIQNDKLIFFNVFLNLIVSLGHHQHLTHCWQ